MSVDFIGAGPYSEIAGSAVNFTGAIVAPVIPDPISGALLGNVRPTGRITLVVVKGAKNFSGVRPQAKAAVSGTMRVTVGTVVTMYGRMQPKAAPMIEYPYVDTECTVSARERITGAVQ